MSDNMQPDPMVTNHTSRPLGTVPKNAQTWIIAGISVVMVAAIALSGGTSPKGATAKPSAAPSAGTIPDPNAARIAEYRLRIEEQARRLAAEQDALARSKQALGGDLPPGTSTTMSTPPPAPAPAAAPPLDEKAQQRRQIEAEREKRDYLSLFSSNVALSLRREPAPQVPPQVPLPDSLGPLTGAAPAVRPPSPVERSPLAVEAAEPEPSGDAAGPKKAAGIDPLLQQAEGKSFRLFEGTIVEAVLTNRLAGSLAGPVNCMVTTDVYSHDRQHLLIPQGSRVLGEVRAVTSFGQQRLALTFHRVVMPDGFSVSLDQFRGLNQIGETGLRDRVDHHYLQTFGVSIAIGAIAGLSQANTRSGFDVSAGDAYRQGVSASLSQSSLRILDRYLNVLPTFTIREGHRIKIYLAADLALPAYNHHRLPSNL